MNTMVQVALIKRSLQVNKLMYIIPCSKNIRSFSHDG